MRVTFLLHDDTAAEPMKEGTGKITDIDEEKIRMLWKKPTPEFCKKIINYPDRTWIIWTEDDVTREMRIKKMQNTISTMTLYTEVIYETDHAA